LTVEAKVENTGGVTATQNVTGTLIGPDDLEIDGFTEEVTLDAGEIAEHTWEFDVPEDADLGTYTFVLETEDDTATATVEVVEAAFFLPSITLIPDDEVVRGGELTVEARVENTGGITATQDVTGTLIGPDDLEIDGFTEEVTLDAGADLEHVWEFDVPEDADLGTYTFVLETEDDTATATVEVVEDPMMLLEDLKDNTSLDLEAVGNVVTATIEYPAEISDVLADYMTDALITADDGFAKGTLVEIKGIGIDGVAELTEETDAIYLSELVEMIDDTLPTRTPITGHAGRTDVLEITITAPVTVNTNLQVAAVVSDDNFATEFEIASDDVDLDFAADKDLALEALKRDTTMIADFDGEVIEVKMFYPAVIDVVLEDYLTDATIEVAAGYDEFPAGTEIEITYNGTVLGTAVLDEDTDGPIFLSDLITMADEDASVRTSITAHAGREDVWEFAIIPADDVRSKLDLATVIDDNDFIDPVVIAEAAVYYEFFPEPEMLALKDLRDNTTLTLTLENANEIKAETQYASENEIRYHAELDDYMVDVLLTAENELVKGTIIEFNGMKVQLEEDEDELYLSDLILMADDEATVRPKVKELFGETDVWNFTISSPVKIEDNKVTAKVMVAKDFEYPITIAQDDVELNIAGDIEELKADLDVTVVENYLYVDVSYDGIAETLKYYNADALIERDYGDRFVAGTEIQIFYNGNEVGVAELTEQTEEIYLSELIAKADPDAPVRTPITAHEGTDEWVLVVSPPGEGRFLAGGTIKSQVSDDDFATAETLDTDTFELDFKYPYDTDNPVYLYDEDGFLEGTYNTIQGAIDEASDDYTLMVYPDEYDENVAINKDGLTLKSVEKHEAVIEGLVTIGDANNFTIEDFKVVNEDERAVYISEDDVANILLKNLDIEVTNANAITNKFPGGIEIEIRDSVISASGNNNHIIYINGGFSSVGELNRPSDVTLIGNQFRGVDLAGGVGVGIEIDNAVVEDNHFDVETDHAAFEIWTAGQGDTTFNIDDDNTFDVTGDGEEILIDTVAYDAGDLPIDQDKHFD